MFDYDDKDDMLTSTSNYLWKWRQDVVDIEIQCKFVLYTAPTPTSSDEKKRYSEVKTTAKQSFQIMPKKTFRVAYVR